MVGEISVEIEPPDGDDKPRPDVESTAEAVPDEESPVIGRKAQRPEHHARREPRMHFERRGKNREQRGEERTAPVGFALPVITVAIGVVVRIAFVPASAPCRHHTSRPPCKLHRDGIVVEDVGVQKDVQTRAEADVVVVVAGIVDAERLQVGRKPAAAAELDLGAVADADFIAVGQALRRLPFVGSLGRPADAIQKREEYRKSCFSHNLPFASVTKVVQYAGQPNIYAEKCGRRRQRRRKSPRPLLFVNYSLSLWAKFRRPMFENLTDKLERSFKILKGEGRITEINIAETLKEIRRALIDADVNYKVAKSFTDEVKQKALGQDVLKAVKPGQMMTKIVRDELALLMGGTATDIRLEGNPAVILIAGLQGSGKTTFSGKLASFIKSKKGRQVLLVAGDVYRPAAIDQLKVLGGQIGVEVYTEEGSKDPVQIAENAIKYARQHAFNVVIVDTAGRLAVDEAMMQEITAIKTAVKPSETLFVVDAMTGQDAVNTAREFNDRLDFDGVVLTKLDGDTRGGAAISIRSVVNKPLKFISSGEKMDALQVFHPERMADRILGMGDVVSLVERAQEQFDEEEARKLKKKLVKNQFNFNDFIGQIQQIKKMGNLKDLASMLPGMGKMLKNVDIPDDVFKQTEAIISSMTPAERERPEIINARRRERIAKGSGTTMADVNRLMKQFEDTRKMMKAVAGGGMKMPKMPGMRR